MRETTRFGGFFHARHLTSKEEYPFARVERFKTVALTPKYLPSWCGQMSVSTRLVAWHAQWSFQAGATRCRDCDAMQAEDGRVKPFSHDVKCESAQAFGSSPWDDLDKLLGNPA
jgi:hypothetical protein